MLTKFDDYPIHQTPEPLAIVATTDRHAYDRYWFNGYQDDGEFYFGIGAAVFPNLGIVDLTVALHYALDTPRDRIVWDVGHQCYTHKLLTGRREGFERLRKRYQGRQQQESAAADPSRHAAAWAAAWWTRCWQWATLLFRENAWARCKMSLAPVGR